MPKAVTFFPLSNHEIQETNKRGVNPKHLRFVCGACGESTNGRVLCEVEREIDGATVSLCVCSCAKEEPCIVVARGGQLVAQYPGACEFAEGENWPPELAQLYSEAAKSFTAGAYTAATMVCRKLLMVTACREGESDGKGFVQYVDHIVNNVLTFPKAKNAIDKIRTIGNDANHQVRFLSPEDAKRAMQIVTYMLNTLYSLPSA